LLPLNLFIIQLRHGPHLFSEHKNLRIRIPPD
jgi:hypothetical protein